MTCNAVFSEEMEGDGGKLLVPPLLQHAVFLGVETMESIVREMASRVSFKTRTDRY